jgi:hypothetical protein
MARKSELRETLSNLNWNLQPLNERAIRFNGATYWSHGGEYFMKKDGQERQPISRYQYDQIMAAKHQLLPGYNEPGFNLKDSYDKRDAFQNAMAARDDLESQDNIRMYQAYKDANPHLLSDGEFDFGKMLKEPNLKPLHQLDNTAGSRAKRTPIDPYGSY